MQDSRDELDRILDEGIEVYVAAEALTGIEERILERIRLSSRPRHDGSGWRHALIYVLAALVIAGSLAVLLHQNAPQPVAIASKTNSSDVHIRTESSKEPPQVRMLHRQRPARQILRSAMATGPKRNSFPTPSPLTREEYLLRLMARTNPDQAAHASESMRQAIQPIEMLPIAIAPLPSGGDGQ